MKKLQYGCIICFIVLCMKCDLNNQKLFLINNTNKTIYYRLLTDTLLHNDLYLYKISPFDSVWPNFVKGRGQGVWEYKINNKSQDSTLYIFVFNVSQLNDSIIGKHKYERMDFKVKDLDSIGWTVVYE